MADKRSIYLGDSLRRLLARHGEHESITQSANSAANLYLEICRRSLLEFDRNEWCALLDALNGYGSPGEHEALSVRAIPLEFADAERLQDLSAKWQVDGPGILQRLQEASFAELAAIGEVAHCFWAHAELETEEALRKALEEW